jgi:hypothetical protein
MDMLQMYASVLSEKTIDCSQQDIKKCRAVTDYVANCSDRRTNGKGRRRLYSERVTGVKFLIG